MYGIYIYANLTGVSIDIYIYIVCDIYIYMELYGINMDYKPRRSGMQI